MEQLISLRPYLFSIAYNMTGTVEDAEDIVQDVFEKWLQAERSEVESAKAYLARMVVNRSIDRLNELKSVREAYKGFWLPEPYITLEADPGLPSIDYALLTLLEKLNPAERAVFILRESFSESYKLIARLTERSEENCRQLLRRAREKVKAARNKPVDADRHRELTEAFLSALYRHDRAGLEEILARDIALFADGGGKRAASLKPLFGIDKVLKFLFGVTQLEEGRETYSYRPGFFNGLPAALLYADSTGELDSALCVVTGDKGISELLFLRNPDKLKVRYATVFTP
jgi:RNA polymerase sigma-70 factor, ECF subfamily